MVGTTDGVKHRQLIRSRESLADLATEAWDGTRFSVVGCDWGVSVSPALHCVPPSNCLRASSRFDFNLARPLLVGFPIRFLQSDLSIFC